MDIRIDETNQVLAKGRVPDTAEGPDRHNCGALVQRILRHWVDFQKEHALALADDGRVSGQERVSLVRRTEAMVQLTLRALYSSLLQVRENQPRSPEEMTVPGREHNLVMLENGTEWQVRERRPQTGDLRIGSLVAQVTRGPVQALAQAMKAAAGDGILDEEELQALLPLILDLLVPLIDLKVRIESCGTSD